ncbi:high mobility group protein HMG-I/HMG-Y isoform X1 [Ambystoma mexicanum]|uniref:high mobility group protein HMG-I/HMG-Y isoform X1 n=1 Tax=Ambystoma mexicanum TaxID=8296 RepID=UPI0037E856D2
MGSPVKPPPRRDHGGDRKEARTRPHRKAGKLQSQLEENPEGDPRNRRRKRRMSLCRKSPRKRRKRSSKAGWTRATSLSNKPTAGQPLDGTNPCVPPPTPSSLPVSSLPPPNVGRIPHPSVLPCPHSHSRPATTPDGKQDINPGG